MKSLVKLLLHHLFAAIPKTMAIHAENPVATVIPPSKKSVLVPLADGVEEVEAVIIIDVLRRAGTTVTVASVENGRKQIRGAWNINIIAECLISDCEDKSYDLVVLPGGMPGSEHFRDSQCLRRIMEKHVKENRFFAAICEAPVVTLQPWGLLKGRHATCHPRGVAILEENSDAVENVVVRDHSLTTSRGPGTAFQFALALVEQLFGEEIVPGVSGPMILPAADGVDVFKLVFNDRDWSTEETPKVLVPVANGSEEMEAVIIVNILRRAGAKVVVASVESEHTIKGRRYTQIVADKLIAEVVDTKFDFVVLPGGKPGAEHFIGSDELTKILKKQVEEGRPHGAICASPAVVLDAHGLLQGKKATNHPGFPTKHADQSAVEARVVIDGLLITSRGPGTAMEFALSIVEKFFGHAKAQEIADELVFVYPKVHPRE